MISCLQGFSGAKARSLICLLSFLGCFSLAPSYSLAAPSKASVSKTKKVVVTKKRRAVSVAAKRHKVRRAPAVVNAKPSVGQIAGLHLTPDYLKLKSNVALVVDQQTSEVLYSKNDKAIVPIASLTKLMTGLIVSESNLDMGELIFVTQDDVDTEKNSRSRLSVGSVLTRGELLHLALMSSENRAAHALGRTYPTGLAAFVGKMNAKAHALGMTDTVYVEPTGLSRNNRSSAHDLAKLVDVAYQHPLLRELTTSPSFAVTVGHRQLQYNTTNRLVKNSTWDIGLQKTGYITEAGRCLVLQASVAGRKLIMVFLDSDGKQSRFADAERVRHWIQSAGSAASARNDLAVAGG